MSHRHHIMTKIGYVLFRIEILKILYNGTR